ncbi:hypothetical protein MHK_002028 [Candidatus Magnetomorum sp. HK-1]|nr:hypothetical protein MHK_002028 [Candidatus Magnetomorum sp. HK-1]
MHKKYSVVKHFLHERPLLFTSPIIEDDTLALYSSQKMKWTVPDFGTSFRGFVDIEIDDQKGQTFLLQNALFYGHLQVDRQIEVELSES